MTSGQPDRGGGTDPPRPPAGLVELRIRGVGVIDSAAWEWGPGLTVITGETGAGKTMVLTGLSLILGGPSDPGLVRAGHDQALVEGRFAADDPEVTDLLMDAGAQADEDGTVLLARTVAAAGRSRAHLGGRSVPAATLAQIGARLVAVHGQDDQHRLLRPAQQRAALDRFGGPTLQEARSAYRATYDEMATVRRQRDDVVAHARERAREAVDLREAIDAVDRLDPRPGEEEALRAESLRLGHAEEILRAVSTARDALASDDHSVSASLAIVRAHVARAAERDPSLADLVERSERLSTESDEIASDLARYLDSLDADPSRIDAVEGRRAALGDLRRRLERTGGWPDLVGDAAAWRDAARARLDELGDDSALLAELDGRLDLLRMRAGDQAATLSAARHRAASALAAAVSQELAALAMGATQFAAQVSAREPGHGDIDLEVEGDLRGADRHGIDDIEFMLVTRGSARPLARAASGGERSRVMLALEVTFAGMDPVPTFVFDEVDAGVGGKAAVEVGHRLARLGRTAQVIVVTHLAQVAAFADRHVVVRPGDVTASSISYVEGQDRITELARMLAGQEESATAAAHAEELLALAVARRTPDLPAGRSGGARGCR